MAQVMGKDPNDRRSARAGVRRLRPSRLAWVPIPVLLTALGAFWAVDWQGSHESAYLLLTLNLVFSLLVCLVVAYLVMRSFLVRGAPGLLLLSCGVVIWGPAGVVATAAARGDANFSITIYNSCVWLSGLCHLAGVSLALRSRRSLSPPVLWLLGGCACAVGAMALVVLLTLAGWMPAFFVEERGGTPMRQVVLISAIVMFALTALLLGATRRGTGPRSRNFAIGRGSPPPNYALGALSPRPDATGRVGEPGQQLSAFAYWYALALLLIAVGLTGVALQTSHASILGWTGRATQALGGLYMLIAAVASVRESRVWEISLEAALREERDFSAAVLETAGALVVVLDAQGRITRFNRACERLTGYSAPDVLGRTFWDFLIPPDEMAKVMETWQAIHAGNVPSRHEHHWLTRDGTRHLLDWSNTALTNEAGRVGHVVAIGIDITERKQAQESLRDANENLRAQAEQLRTFNDMLQAKQQELEEANEDLQTQERELADHAEALRASQERLALAASGTRIGMYDWNVATGETLWTEQVSRLLGLRTTTTTTTTTATVSQPYHYRDWTERVHPEDLPRVEAELDRCMTERAPYDAEYRAVWPDGTVRWVADRGVFQYESDGQCTRMLGILMDITERKRAEEALRENQALVHAVVDGSPDLIYVKDTCGRILMANRPACEALGRPTEQVIGQTACRFHGDDPEVGRAIMENDRHIMESGRTETIEEPGSKGRTYLSTKAPYRGADGSIIGLIGISHDITERKRAEERLRRALQDTQRRCAEISALMTCTRAVAECRDLLSTTRTVFDACRKLLGAPAGYVAVLTPDGEDNKVLFLEPGGLSCTVDPTLPMPVRGFRGEVYRTGRVVYENDFAHSRWAELLPPGHVRLENALFAPIVIDGRTVGLLGLGNKPGGFTDQDATLAATFGELVAIALRNSRMLDSLRELNATLESKVTQRTAELEHRTRQLQKLTLELSQAEERERRRVAVILHEDLQQQIAGAKFHLSLLNGHAKQESQHDVVLRIDEMLKEAIEKSRRLSYDLSPAVLHMNDLAEVLLWLAKQVWARHGLTVHVEVMGEAILQSESLTVFLFRAAQEVLLNVVKHARVSEATIRVRRVGRHVCLCISDTGRGFDPQELKDTAGFGLLAIRERVELLGGRMKIRSFRDRGTAVRIVVPEAPENGRDAP